jgi:hypothetical protein
LSFLLSFFLALNQDSKPCLISFLISFLNALSIDNLIFTLSVVVSEKFDPLSMVPENRKKHVPPPLSLVWSHRTLQIKSVFIKRFIEVVIDDCWKPKLINFSRYWKIYVLVKFTTVRHTICPTPYAYLLTKVQGVRSWFFYQKWQLVVIAYVENIKVLTHSWRKKMLKYSQIFYLSILSHPLCLPPDETTRS